MFIWRFVLLLCLQLVSTHLVFAYLPSENILSNLDELPIDSRLISLFEQSETEPKFAKEILPSIELTGANFNAAEKYLLLMIKANTLVEPDKDKKIISLLLQTEPLIQKIGLAQLNSSPFIHSSLMFANSYAAINEFQKAYEHKKLFIDRFLKNRAAERKHKIAIIDEKYETNRKTSENELLVNQSKLKKLQLKKADNKKAMQLRNIIILVLTAIIFLLLLFRQYSLKKALKLTGQVDHLTQLLNQKALYKKGGQAFNNMLDKEKNMVIMVMTVDDFSEINEKHGYHVGDTVLQTVAQLGQETMRERDVFSRLGNARFSAVLPEATLGEAKAISERLREKIASIKADALNLNNPLTISVGIASIEDVPDGFEPLINAATEAMHNAQDNGHNQVSIYQVK